MEMSPELKARHEQHDTWVREVRDPAQENSEGVRVITANKNTAEYEIAQIPNGYAISHSFSRKDAGMGSPWTKMSTREECLLAFVDAAKKYFSDDKQMLDQLESGLFGFIEPDVDQDCTNRQAEILKMIEYQKSLCKKWIS